ncbi:hypothetical protein BN946_scf184569.g66 [Trametes cinnabarina]|uniref:Uncharacterized protein n=1 Tax=Pycnoporus cinnabarinus TaxID=5643 RepID=A0A060SDP0_PYCCI|nr:hypothetical protein BN946_scf184569.g66 [Trametes cinnabarina]
MAAWVLAHPPWHSLSRIRLRWDVLLKPQLRIHKQFLNIPSLPAETPMMREIKAFPYPGTTPDSSLFEESTDEYQEAALDTHSASDLHPVPEDAGRPGVLLKELIKAARMQDATRVYDELVAMGAEVPMHPVYHFAARHALRNPTLSQKERVAAVMKWWSLVPPRSAHADIDRSVQAILAELLRNDIAPDIPLLISWSLLAASKGCALEIWQDIIPIVSRYAPAPTVMTFLDQFCAASLAYEASLVEPGGNPRDVKERMQYRYWPWWYHLAIRKLLSAGKIYTALSLLRVARSRNIPVPLPVYSVMEKIMEKEGDTAAIAYIRRTRHLTRQRYPWMIKEKGPTAPPSSSDISPQELEQLLHAPLDSRGTLVQVARSLKKAIKAGSLPVSASRLAEFIRAFQLAGRATLVSRLRVLAYKRQTLMSLWALADMVRHVSMDRPIFTVMKVFEANFHVVGIPRGLFDALWRERRRNPSAAAQWRPPIRRKLPPARQHVHFVWQTILEAARTKSQVQRLYVLFLQDVALSRDVPFSFIPSLAARGITESVTDSEDYILPIPPPCLFSSRSFVPFMRAFLRLKLWPVATSVIVDMYSLGIKPDDPELFDTFVHALKFPPWSRPVTDAAIHLEKLIRSHKPHHESPSLTSPYHNVASTRADALETSTVAFIYTGVLRRLLLDGRGAAPRTAAFLQHFKNRVPYQPGTNPETDAVLRELSQLNAATQTSTLQYTCADT